MEKCNIKTIIIIILSTLFFIIYCEEKSNVNNNKSENTDKKNENNKKTEITTVKLFLDKNDGKYKSEVKEKPKEKIYYKVEYNNDNNVIKETRLDNEYTYGIITKDYYENGKTKSISYKDSNEILEKREILFENGKIKEFEKYEDGKIKNKKIFDKSGEIKTQIEYKNGKKTSEKQFLKEDVLEYEKYWENEKKNGIWKYYDEIGRVIKIEEWNKNFVKHPIATHKYTYNPNGTRYSYIALKLYREKNDKDEFKELIKDYNPPKIGKFYKIIINEYGQILKETVIEDNDILEIVMYSYNYKNNLKSKRYFDRHSKPIKLEKFEYYENDSLRKTEEYKNDLLVKEKIYYEGFSSKDDNILKMETIFSNGNKSSIKYYNRLGYQVKEEKFKDGKLIDEKIDK